MTAKHYVVVDVGASGGRVLAGHFDGERLSLEACTRFPNGYTTMKDDLLWDIFAIYGHIQEGMAAFRKRFGDAASIGIDTWGVDFGLLDRRGQLIGHPHCYRDPRTTGMMDALHGIVPAETIYRRTANCPSLVNTLYHLAGMVALDDPALETAETLLMIPDLLNYFLCGEMTTEYSNASTTQFMNPFAKAWDYELLNTLQLPSRFLTAITPPGRVVGQTLPLIEVATGLGCPVVSVASHDTASAVLAAVPSSAHSAYLSTGTWCIVGIVRDQPILTDAFYRDRFTNEGTFQGSFRPAKNINGLWMLQECKRHYETHVAPIDWNTFTRFASDAKPFQAFVNPDDERFFSSGDMPQRVRDYCAESGQHIPESIGDVLRVITESLAMRFAWAFRSFEGALGAPLDVLDAVGGGTQNGLLMQFTANAIDRPVRVGHVEGTAIGNLMAQLIACGDVASLEEAQELVRRSSGTLEFLPEDVERWREAYGAYLCVVERQEKRP